MHPLVRNPVNPFFSFPRAHIFPGSGRASPILVPMPIYTPTPIYTPLVTPRTYPIVTTPTYDATPVDRRCSIVAIVIGIVAIIAAIALIILAKMTYNPYALVTGVGLAVGGTLSLMLGSLSLSRK